MGAADVVGLVRGLASRVAGPHGLEIFDVQFRREAGGMVVRVQIDRPGPASTAGESVSVEDCARVSRDLSAMLDVEDVVPGAYILEVSSPGLDRPLRHLDDYRRFSGRRAKLVVREAVDGQKFFRGRLAGVETAVDTGHDKDADRETEEQRANTGPAVLIDVENGRRHRVPIGVIARAHLEVDF